MLLLCHGLSQTPRRLGATFTLPAWIDSPAAREVNEPAALKAIGKASREVVKIETAELRADIATSFWRTDAFKSPSAPKLLFLHGADSSFLEWRYVVDKLGAQGLDCTAIDWWSGGWTDRDPITASPLASTEPWTLVRQHLHAFWEQQLQGEPVILVGTSLGGAVALDFATAHPEAVRALCLIDAGGQSYKAPPPAVVSALAPAVLAVKSFAAAVQAALPSEDSRIGGLHRSQLGWREAYGAYLASGSYAVRVGRELIRTVPQSTLVLWGTDDPILPLADAYAFEADLPNCAGVVEVPGTGHSPHLEDPERVAGYIADFVRDVV